MKLLTNPYKGDNPEPLRKVQADVGQADWERVFLGYPFRGMQDTIISTLYKRFADEVKARGIPTHYEPGNLQAYENILRGLTFSRTGGRGPGDDGRGNSPSVSLHNQTGPSVSTD